MQGNYPGGCEGWKLDGPQEDREETGCEWGSCVSSTIGPGIGKLGGNYMHRLACVDEELARCEACQAFGKAPHAGGSSFLGRHHRPACYGRLLQVHPLHTRPREESRESLGRLLQYLDWSFRPPVLHPDGGISYDGTAFRTANQIAFSKGLVRTPGFLNAAMV